MEWIAEQLNYLLSLVSMRAIVNNVISWVIIGVLGAAVVYLWKPLRGICHLAPRPTGSMLVLISGNGCEAMSTTRNGKGLRYTAL